jgi:hypothetical protein
MLSMQFEHSHRIAASPAQIFARYADVTHWHEWDEDLKQATIHGAFASGTSFIVEPKSGPKSTAWLRDVRRDQGFAVECKLPLCLMRFEYELAPTGGGTVATHRVVFSGALSWLFGRLIGPGMKKGLPHSMRRLESLVVAEAQ